MRRAESFGEPPTAGMRRAECLGRPPTTGKRRAESFGKPPTAGMRRAECLERPPTTGKRRAESAGEPLTGGNQRIHGLLGLLATKLIHNMTCVSSAFGRFLHTKPHSRHSLWNFIETCPRSPLSILQNGMFRRRGGQIEPFFRSQTKVCPPGRHVPTPHCSSLRRGAVPRLAWAQAVAPPSTTTRW